jgi:hypothetical protein
MAFTWLVLYVSDFLGIPKIYFSNVCLVIISVESSIGKNEVHIQQLKVLPLTLPFARNYNTILIYCIVISYLLSSSDSDIYFSFLNWSQHGKLITNVLHFFIPVPFKCSHEVWNLALLWYLCTLTTRLKFLSRYIL